jgi:hypothetical protein
LVLGIGSERGLHAVPVSRKPEAQPDWVVTTAAETGVIRAHGEKWIDRRRLKNSVIDQFSIGNEMWLSVPPRGGLSGILGTPPVRCGSENSGRLALQSAAL